MQRPLFRDECPRRLHLITLNRTTGENYVGMQLFKRLSRKNETQQKETDETKREIERVENEELEKLKKLKGSVRIPDHT